MSIHETLKKSIPDALRARDEDAATNDQLNRHRDDQRSRRQKRKPDEFLTDDEAFAVIKRLLISVDSIEQFGSVSQRPRGTGESRARHSRILSPRPDEPRRDYDYRKGENGRTRRLVQSRCRKFTGALMKELKGKADGGDVKAVVDSLLS